MAKPANFNEIKKCIKNWNGNRGNDSSIMNCFDQGNSFKYKNEYDMSQYSAANQVLHVYPGMDDQGTFYMFLIPQAEDIAQSDSALFNAITICEVEPNIGNSHEIPSQEAILRIDTWKKDYPTWTRNQITKSVVSGGVFQAFYMPADYLVQYDEYITYLGLQTSTTAATGFDADLITTDLRQANVYYDTARPVPPFHALPVSQSSFYLLTIS
ncbi:hypothetical protein [Flavobacterium sp. C4GT6]|uniref:hypothetical protein n=1 Tax=Flavobacterium sp. C4GT6 TaxID=3103818 RepID=UPI002ED1DCDB